MKIYNYFIGLISACVLTACSDWLDLQPQDTIEEDQLFETGDGFRNALNGVYAQMATSNLYGKELTWGGLDAMAQYYSPGYGTQEYYFGRYTYTDSKIRSVIQNIWSDAYNCVANCNNLIQRVEKEPAMTFTFGEEEKNLIWGEALALRAIIHFDLFRLFAPGKDGGEKYLPYVDFYPCTFKEYDTYDDFLQKVVKDLLKAKELVGKFDLERPSWMLTRARYENDYPYTGFPEDLFLAFRGYRMNYYAICGMLARVYLYQEKYKEAFDEATILIDAEGDEYGTKCFSFTNSSSVGTGNSKLYDEVAFCLSNQQIEYNFQTYYMANELNLSYSVMDWFEEDDNDVRTKILTSTADGWDYYSSKYLPADGAQKTHSKDMIPMLRIGEMYFIRAEYYNQQNNKEAALEEIANVRRGHRCSNEYVDSSGDDWFKTKIIEEARREFVGEGQLFFYYKRLGVKPSGMKDEKSFVLPYPDNEAF